MKLTTIFVLIIGFFFLFFEFIRFFCFFE